MIFTVPKYMPMVFNQSLFDAINIYGYFKSHTLEQVTYGLSCDINEFNVDHIMLRLATYLNYTDIVDITHEALNEFLTGLKSSISQNQDIEEPVLKGFYLLYLILSEKDDYFENFSANNKGIILDEIKIILNQIAEESSLVEF